MSGLDIKPLKARIGSEVRIDAETLIGGIFATELRALLVERGVLLFRDLDIDLVQQRAITAGFGRIRPGAVGDGLQKVTIDKDESPEFTAYVATTFFWHMDGHYGQTTPCFGGSFRPVRLSADGGETEFLNAYAAYEGLSAADRQLVDSLRVVHSQAAAGLAATPDADAEQAAGWCRAPRAVQPLVWEHKSGRRSLLLGGSVSHVEDMHPADSFDLLLRLRHHMAQPCYVYSHSWRENDLIVWNNSGTMHRARPYDPTSRRLLHRFTLDGEEDIRAPA